MAKTRSSRINDLKPYALKHGYRAVIALCIGKRGKYAVNSFGLNKKLCDAAKNVNNQLFEAVLDSYIRMPDELIDG